jgi:serine phosphatase RsbU (regulator of sigma subunit)
MFPDACYTFGTFQLEVFDYLVAYTDGITEAQANADEMCGQHRLETLLCSGQDQTPQQIRRYFAVTLASIVRGTSSVPIRPERRSITPSLS